MTNDYSKDTINKTIECVSKYLKDKTNYQSIRSIYNGLKDTNTPIPDGRLRFVIRIMVKKEMLDKKPFTMGRGGIVYGYKLVK